MPRRVHVALALLIAASDSWGCSLSRHPGTAAAAAPTPVSDVRPTASVCKSASCFELRAAKSLARGVVDVAASELGKAFVHDPSRERLEAYLAQRKANGETRKLRADIDANASRFPEVVGPYRDGAPSRAQDRPTLLNHVDAPFARALAQERAGETVAAVASLLASSTATHPAALARLGLLHEKNGNHQQARAVYAAARIASDERGATLRLVAFDTGFATNLGFVDGLAVRISGWRHRDYTHTLPVSRLEFLDMSTSDVGNVVQEIMISGDGGTVAGGRLYTRPAADARTLQVFDLQTGTKLGDLGLPTINNDIHIIDEGPNQRFLVVRTDQRLALFSIPEELVPAAPLQSLGSFTYSGTTPTITRAYTGDGAEHLNILNEDPSWPVSFAVSPDLRYFAYGTSDSIVHLHAMNDKKGKAGHKLEVAWTYEERRMGGGNADRNNPLDLRFTTDGLVVAYGRGDVQTFSTTGKRIAWRKGECSAKALRSYASRFRPMEPTDEDQEGCGRFERAVLSPKGTYVAATGPFDLRVVPSTPTGAEPIAYVGTNLGAHLLTWASEQRVLFGNLYGQVWEWREGEPVRSLTETRDGTDHGPRQPRLSSDLRILQWGGDHQPLVGWDLWTGQRRAADKERADIQTSGDLGYTAIANEGRTVVRNAEGERVYPFKGGSCETLVFLNEAGTFFLATYEGSTRFVDLRAGTERVLKLKSSEQGRPRDELVLSHDGQRLAIYAEDAMISVYDTASGRRLRRIVADPGEYKRALAIAPDGAWVAWEVQHARPDQGLPELTVQLVGLIPGVKNRSTTVLGWVKALVTHPNGSEVLVVTENSLTRWNPRTGTATLEDTQSVSANRIGYSETGRVLIFEAYDRVELRANTPGIPQLARIYIVDGTNWFVQTHQGAVDGSAGAHHSLATIVEGPMDTSVLPGAVAWDRFVAPGLMANLDHPLRSPASSAGRSGTQE